MLYVPTTAGGCGNLEPNLTSVAEAELLLVEVCFADEAGMKLSSV